MIKKPEYADIEVKKIEIGLAKIRRDIEERIEELARSIESEGLIHPLVVFKTDDKYQLVLGHRRFMAISKILGWEKVPALIYPPMKPADIYIAVLTDETHKVALTPDEKAEATIKAVEEEGTYEAAARRLG